MEAAVIHERLAQEYGFTGNYQRTKLYVQIARPRIATSAQNPIPATGQSRPSPRPSRP
ncbi:hypothetical protein [Streptomyces misionensis]